MKKILLLLLFPSMTWAQSNISFGGNIGGNLSTITDTSDYKYHPGLNVGAFIIWGPVEHWGFTGGLNYSREGAKYSYNSTDYNVDAKTNLSYLRIPVTVTYFLNKYDNPIRPKIFLGPNFGFLLGGKTKSDVTFHGQTTSNEQEAKDYINGFDFGVEGGIGCNFRLSDSGTWLNLDATFYRGLVDISKNNDQNNYNQHFSLNAGITFPFGYVKPE